MQAYLHHNPNDFSQVIPCGMWTRIYPSLSIGKVETEQVRRLNVG